jgi:hypothetical protein
VTEPQESGYEKAGTNGPLNPDAVKEVYEDETLKAMAGQGTAATDGTDDIQTGYLVTVERSIGETEILQRVVTDAESMEEAVENFNDYYSDFWGDDTSESTHHKNGYVRPDYAEYVTLHSVESVADGDFEALQGALNQI